jgi:hypothetical protein
MKTNRVWIEIVILGTAIACALALLIATLGTAAGAAVGQSGTPQEKSILGEQTHEGMVSCSRCGARHSAARGETAADCVRICVRGGASFALVEADATYLLDGDLNVLKKVAGQRARVVGSLDGKTIRISSVAAS